MKKIFTLLCIGIVAVSPLYAQVTSSTFDPAWAARLQNALNTALPASGVHGVSVAITFPGMGTFIGVAGESAPGIPMTPDMQFGIGSNTKLFTAVLVMKLVELGKLSLDDPLSRWLPSYTNVDGSATIRQCLSHQSGIFDYDTPTPEEAASPGPINYPDTFFSPDYVLSFLNPPYFAPGHGYHYSNTNYNLLGLILEAATGSSYTQLLHQYILDPLHMDSTFLAAYEAPNGTVAHGWYYTKDVGPVPIKAAFSTYWSAGGIFSTASEMVQWYDSLFAGRVISQSSLDQILDFEATSFEGFAVDYVYFPLLPDEPVDGFSGGVPGYTSKNGYDVKRHSSLFLLINQGGNPEAGNQAFKILFPLLTEFYINYPRKPNDAGVDKVIAPVAENCNTQITPQVALKNFGSANLTSAIIHYQLDGGTVNTYNWTGNLQTDQTAMVSLPNINTTAGNHSFRSFTSNPNGSVEEYTYNDEASSKFNVNSTSPPNSIHEGFEGSFPPPGWVNGNNTMFDWRKTSLVSMNGSGCMVKQNEADATARSYDVELPLTNLSSMKNPVLSFNYAYAFTHGFVDGLSVSISKNCGATYNSVFNRTGQALKTSNSNELFFPKSNEWGLRTINLSAYKGRVVIKFTAKNGNGNNLFIDNVTISDITDLCAAPTDLNELQITASSIKLSWKFQGNANHFDVYYRPWGAPVWNHSAVAGNKQWTNISGLLASTDYEWYITAACASGNSLNSASSNFTTEPSLLTATTPLQQMERANISTITGLKIAPNPASSSAVISFSLSKPEKVLLDLYDATGRLVQRIAGKEFNEGSHHIGINIKELGSAIYFVRMQAEGAVQTRKLVIVR